MRIQSQKRRAFSLMELLIVIAIIGVLIALLLPALQRVRAAALLARCGSNLKQIGIALAQFHDMHKVYPSNGGWDGVQTIPSVAGPPFTPETYDYTTSAGYKWGVGDPRLKPTDQMGSWGYALLPHIEQSGLYEQRQWTVGVDLYICPTRRTPIAKTVVAGDSYGKYESGGWEWGRTDYAVSLGAFDNRPQCHPSSRVTDGLSNTIFAGEKAYDVTAQGPSWYWDEPFFLGGSKGTSRDAPVMIPDRTGILFRDNWGSPHVVGVQFLFGDGSARALPFDTPPSIVAALMTVNAADTVPLP